MPLPESFDEFVSKIGAPAKCSSEGCTNSADYVLRIHVWAKGHPKTLTPLDMTLTWRVCADHRHVIKPNEFWVDETKERINGALRALGRAQADFDSAEFEWVKASTALGGGMSVN